MSVPTIRARTELPVSTYREVIAAIVRLDILEITVKQVRKYHPSFVFLPILICIGNRLNASAIIDLHYGGYLKILSKLYKPLGECNLKEF